MKFKRKITPSLFSQPSAPQEPSRPAETTKQQITDEPPSIQAFLMARAKQIKALSMTINNTSEPILEPSAKPYLYE